MTTTPPLSIYSPQPPQPEIVYSNFPTTDQYYPPCSPHAIWWLENADIFLSMRGIVYGLRRIHFIQSSLFQRLLSITRLDILYGTTTGLPIPFDKIGFKFSKLRKTGKCPMQYDELLQKWIGCISKLIQFIYDNGTSLYINKSKNEKDDCDISGSHNIQIVSQQKPQMKNKTHLTMKKQYLIYTLPQN